MTNEEPPPTWPETIGRAGAALVPGPLGGAAAIVVDDVFARRRARSAEFLTSIVDGLDEETVHARLRDDRIGTLIGNAGDAAVTSAHEAKRRALARVARNAIDDDALVDESELLTAVLAGLEAPHIATLARLNEADLQLDKRSDPDAPNPVHNAAAREIVYILAPLLSAGLIIADTANVSLPAPWNVGGVTSLGRKLLEYLENSDTGTHQ